MRRFTMLTICLLALASCMATTAWAGSPHFIKVSTPTIDSSNGNLTISFKESGLGNTPVTYTLEAGEASFTFQCFTKSHNTPQGDPNSVSFSAISEQTTITPHNGQITSTISLQPLQGGASCTGQGLVLVLIHVHYADVTFTDTTDGVLGGTFPGPFDSDVSVKF
jgi:hypothetical protein